MFLKWNSDFDVVRSGWMCAAERRYSSDGRMPKPMCLSYENSQGETLNMNDEKEFMESDALDSGQSVQETGSSENQTPEIESNTEEIVTPAEAACAASEKASISAAMEELESSEKVEEVASVSVDSVQDHSDLPQLAGDESDGTAAKTQGDLTADGEALQQSELTPKERFLDTLTQAKNALLQVSLPHCIMRLVGIFLIISSAFVVHHYALSADHSYQPISNWHEFRDAISLPMLALFVVGDYILLSLIKTKLPGTRLDSCILLIGLVLFSLVTLWRNDNVYYTYALILITAVSGFAAVEYDRKCAKHKLPFAVTLILVILLAAFVAFVVAFSTICQFKSYGTSCYDMGIFIQMYHSMIHDLSLVTTCERGEFLSHLAVHFSPIYYLLLPFYFFFPSANTLLIAQAVMITLGVFPLIGICRKYHFRNGTTLFFCITYLFCAELIGPCYYHFHENAFLPMLLMFLFYAIEKKKPVMIYIFMALVLFVKEDAPIYIVCIGIYLLFRKDMTGIRKHGAIMAAIGAAYFGVVTTLMGKYGEGVMTSRTYGNLMIDQDAGFGEIIKTVILDPAYFISQLLREDTFLFFLSVMIPLGIMPLFTKKFSRLMLFAPFVLMNLASGYVYASNRDFQYVFGTATCLIYATVINAADLRPKKRQMVAAYTAMASLFVAFSAFSGKVMWKYEYYRDNTERFSQQDEVLSSIPDDASVVCDTWFVPFLANRDEIYEMNDTLAAAPSTTDFVVVRISENYDYNEGLLNKLETEGYTYYDGIESVLEIYVSPTYEFQSEK